MLVGSQGRIVDEHHNGSERRQSEERTVDDRYRQLHSQRARDRDEDAGDRLAGDEAGAYQNGAVPAGQQEGQERLCFWRRNSSVSCRVAKLLEFPDLNRVPKVIGILSVGLGGLG